MRPSYYLGIDAQGLLLLSEGRTLVSEATSLGPIFRAIREEAKRLSEAPGETVKRLQFSSEFDVAPERPEDPVFASARSWIYEHDYPDPWNNLPGYIAHLRQDEDDEGPMGPHACNILAEALGLTLVVEARHDRDVRLLRDPHRAPGAAPFPTFVPSSRSYSHPDSPSEVLSAAFFAARVGAEHDWSPERLSADPESATWTDPDRARWLSWARETTLALRRLLPDLGIPRPPPPPVTPEAAVAAVKAILAEERDGSVEDADDALWRVSDIIARTKGASS